MRSALAQFLLYYPQDAERLEEVYGWFDVLEAVWKCDIERFCTARRAVIEQEDAHKVVKRWKMFEHDPRCVSGEGE